MSQAGAAADSGGGSGSSSAGQPGAAAGGGGGGRAGAAALSGGAGAPAGAGGAAGTGAAGTSAPEERTYEGTWSGKTSQGGDFSFSVDGATVRQLKIRYIVDPNNDCHSPYVDHVIHTASPIISGFWEYKVTDGWTHDVTCDFQTASSARGTYDAKAQIKNPDGSVACNLASKGTWTATKQ